MIVALFYLSCIHLHRQYNGNGTYSLDITGPLMIITQKVTSLAFSIHDGFMREKKVNKILHSIFFSIYIYLLRSFQATKSTT